MAELLQELKEKIAENSTSKRQSRTDWQKG
jgi:hypothetical protein